MREKGPLVPEFKPDEVTKRRPSDYLLRFAFGAAISLVAGIAGMLFGPKVGGVLLGFPAILPASLTLIEKKEGREQASVDSIGAVLGAVALVGFAVAVSLSVTKLGVAVSITIALVVWLAVAALLYLLVAGIYRREPHAP